MHSSNQLNSARARVLTQRNFNSFAEDPAAATQAFKLRRFFSRTNDQVTNSTDLISKFQSAWTSAGTTKNLVEEAANNATLQGLNTPTGSGRQPLGQVLSSTAESIIQTLNIKYNDSFIFGGNDAQTVPFSWDNNGNLLYRGISVDTGSKGAPEGTPPDPSQEPSSTAWGQYYASNPDFAKLAQMSYETSYVDVGAGLAEDSSGKLNSATAFNSAISGLNLLSFGVDEDGDPKNTVSIIKQLSDIFLKCDADSGEYASTKDQEDAKRLNDKLQDSLAALTKDWVHLDGQSDYLTTNKERLQDYSDNLNEQILSFEQANLADAITDFSWAQYCYNSALKVGNDILSQSLIDYMN
jgi:flagellar hook-associated protein 3 FlgL